MMRFPLILAYAAFSLSGSVYGGETPNILFIIADDASRHFGEAYGCDWVKTPNIDRLARNGIVFENAYTPTSKCAPSRAAILTGRNPWQLEEAANHQPYFPVKYKTFSEALREAGIAVGSQGKTWGPGDSKKADGSPRDFGFTSSGGKGKGGPPGQAFATFLEKRDPSKPFFYWFGSANPHRPYKADSGIAAGKKLSDIPHVPAYWPDNEIVRRDMLDYAVEVEAYDSEVGELVTSLEQAGLTKNTLIVVTSDHGMPFPRVKGHTFEEAHHVPLIASWPQGIANPGRRVGDLVSFIDLAPTFLEIMGVQPSDAGMAAITGDSLLNLLQGQSKNDREFVVIGRERNDVLTRPGSPAGLGYPVRGIRQGSLLYIHNFEPDRWPCGDPGTGFRDTDASPTKALAESLPETSVYWQFAFGKHPREQLFDVSKDPDCVQDLAKDAAHAQKMAVMRELLMTELKRQDDPRVLGQGALFDNYLSPRTQTVDKPRKSSRPLP